MCYMENNSFPIYFKIIHVTAPCKVPVFIWPDSFLCEISQFFYSHILSMQTSTITAKNLWLDKHHCAWTLKVKHSLVSVFLPLKPTPASAIN